MTFEPAKQKKQPEIMVGNHGMIQKRHWQFRMQRWCTIDRKRAL